MTKLTVEEMRARNVRRGLPHRPLVDDPVRQAQALKDMKARQFIQSSEKMMRDIAYTRQRQFDHLSELVGQADHRQSTIEAIIARTLEE